MFSIFIRFLLTLIVIVCTANFSLGIFYQYDNILRSNISYSSIRWKGLIEITDVPGVEYKDIITFATYNDSYSQIISRNGNDSVCFFSSSVIREYGRLVHLKNVYCTSRQALACNNKQIRLNFLRLTFQLRTKIEYENVIYLYSLYMGFGHWFQDALPGILYFSDELIQKSKIIVCSGFTQRWLELFNISSDQIIFDRGYWYYCKNLYMFYCLDPVNSLNIKSFLNLSIVISRKLQLNKIVSSRYVFTNKDLRLTRSIANMDEFILSTKISFPEYNWELDPFNKDNLIKLIKNVASFKIWITPSGSQVMNMAFMKRDWGCGVCTVHSNKIDYPDFGLGITLSLWQIGFINNVSHYANMININVTEGVRSIGRLIYAIKYHKWPENTFLDMEPAFDLPLIYNKFNNSFTKIFEVMPNTCKFYKKMKKQFKNIYL